jgi:hypothetical protein
MVFHEKIKKKLKVIFLMFLNHFNVLISKIKIYYFDIYTYIYMIITIFFIILIQVDPLDT